MDSASDKFDGRRAIALLDMDCFYVQVEQRDNPVLWGKPVGVVQYDQFLLGSLIAVSYEARDQGVKRWMTGAEAKSLCPDLTLVSTPTKREKVDLTKYRNASSEVFDVLAEFTECVLEGASIDEAYLDLTKWADREHERLSAEEEVTGVTFADAFKRFCSEEQLASTHIFLRRCTDAAASSNEGTVASYIDGIADSKDKIRMYDQKLLIAAVLVERIRRRIKERTCFHCSAGISHNKILAKLACGVNKPRKQTVLPRDNVAAFFEDVPIQKIRGLGGKLGQKVVGTFGISTVAQLSKVSIKVLTKKLGAEIGLWLFNIARGINHEPVEPKGESQTVGCSKNLPGLQTMSEVRRWISVLSEELLERLLYDRSEFRRTATSVSYAIRFGKQPTVTRQMRLAAYDAAEIAKTAMKVFESLYKAPQIKGKGVATIWCRSGVTHLGMSANSFEDYVALPHITRFFKPIAKSEQRQKESAPLSSSLKKPSDAVASQSILTTLMKPVRSKGDSHENRAQTRDVEHPRKLKAANAEGASVPKQAKLADERNRNPGWRRRRMAAEMAGVRYRLREIKNRIRLRLLPDDGITGQELTELLNTYESLRTSHAGLGSRIDEVLRKEYEIDIVPIFKAKLAEDDARMEIEMREEMDRKRLKKEQGVESLPPTTSKEAMLHALAWSLYALRASQCPRYSLGSHKPYSRVQRFEQMRDDCTKLALELKQQEENPGARVGSLASQSSVEPCDLLTMTSQRAVDDGLPVCGADAAVSSEDRIYFTCSDD